MSQQVAEGMQRLSHRLNIPEAAEATSSLMTERYWMQPTAPEPTQAHMPAPPPPLPQTPLLPVQQPLPPAEGAPSSPLTLSIYLLAFAVACLLGEVHFHRRAEEIVSEGLHVEPGHALPQPPSFLHRESSEGDATSLLTAKPPGGGSPMQRPWQRTVLARS